MKRKTLVAFRITFAAVIAVILNSCFAVTFNDFNSITGTGEPVSYDINIGKFTGIKVEGFCDIQYYWADSDFVTLTVQPNLREYFIIEVIDDDLVIRTTRRISYNHGKNPVLKVSTPVLERLTFEGACNFIPHNEIVSDSLTVKFKGAAESKAEINVNKLSVDISGAGKFELSGRADTADFNVAGAGELNARSLLTRIANVNFSGAGSLKINCSENLSIKANGVGSIEYSGNPALNLDINGLVDIKRIN